ncbi:TolB-like protein [Mycoplana sp. BE70]|uniref:hypothetical protein n=1 Tax=Mycoplana sp. BE70 TaxID=2817775 RepID=UPI00286073B7|nr:hypothetical protein [Mycoplana sp. BE70]MDR6755270.1 TolB-like protein [Mycoplana sp. BE70]
MSLAFPQSAPADVSTPPTNSEIEDQLARIRSSSAFDAPDRAHKFLTYVVQEALQGRADRIKAYSIAIEVFGRDATFDAQNDPVVRIEAGRVRRALERYYLLAGQKDPILITMPKGGYVPVFTRFTGVEPGTPAPRHERSWLGVRAPKIPWSIVGIVALAIAGMALLANLARWEFRSPESNPPASAVPDMPQVVVRPFEDLTGTRESAMIARGLTDEVIGQMARFKEISVIAGRPDDGGVKERATRNDLPLYALEGRVRADNDKLRLTTRLLSRADNSVVWTGSFDADLGVRQLLDMESDVARAVATALAQPYGVIFQADAAQMLQAPPSNWKAYACTLSYYGYRADLSPQTHASVQSCLKETVEHFPNYATAWALLSLTYIDELRFRYRLEPPSPPLLDLAIQAAERAVELDPENVRALQAEMLARFFQGDVETALAVGERAFRINPNDTELSGEYGFRLALSGQWQRGCGIVAETVGRNPGPMGYFQMALAICSYIDGDYSGAERWARLADLRENAVYHLILTAILSQQGKLAQANEERNWLETHAPQFLNDLRKEVALRVHRPQDQQQLYDGLRKAGIAILPQ